MAIKNKTKYAILGILSISPGSGYDIKKYCDTIISNFWHENYGHIYPVLNGMLKEGLITINNENSSARKKEYAITENGREDFLNWLMDPVEYQPVRSEFFLKFVFSSNLPRENVLTMLDEYKLRHETKLRQLKETETFFHKDQVNSDGATNKENQKENISPARELFLYAPLRYGILSAEAAITWCEEMIEAFTALT